MSAVGSVRRDANHTSGLPDDGGLTRAGREQTGREQTGHELTGRRFARGDGPFWWFRQIASWLFLFVVVAVLGAMLLVPRLAGAETYTVLTGSMEPGIQPGDLVVVRPVSPDQVAIGSVVTYQLVSGQSAVVTHRVVGLSLGTDGAQRFITQGDANNAPDPDPVRAVQLRGELWYSLPLLGYLNSAISGEWHIWLLAVAVAGLLGYAVLMLLSAWRDRHQRAGTVQT